MKSSLIKSLLLLTLSIVAHAGEFNTGDTVVVNALDHREAKILEVYSDGMARIKFLKDNYTTTYSISELNHPIKSLKGFSVDETVVVYSLDHREAKILGVYKDGMARIIFKDGYFTTLKLSELNKPINSFNGFSVGDKVIVNALDHREAKILGVYKDGMARIVFKNGYFATFKLSELSLND